MEIAFKNKKHKTDLTKESILLPGRNEILLDIGDQTDPHNTPLLRTTHLI